MAQLTRIEDPRDRLQKARRIELIRFAQANGVSEVNPEMPADLMRQILRTKGMTNIDIPPRVLGRPYGAPAVVPQTQAVPSTDATADLARQWKQQQAKEQPKELTMNELRAACKAAGIKMSRKDNMETLKAKLAENGKNTT